MSCSEGSSRKRKHSYGMYSEPLLDAEIRKQPDDTDSDSQRLLELEAEMILYNLIRSKQDMGIWPQEMKRETNLRRNVVFKALRALKIKKLVKQFVNIQNKGRIYYVAAEFEPSDELTGGVWYVDGKLQTEYIKRFKESCVYVISKLKVATEEGIAEYINMTGLCVPGRSRQQIVEILRVLVLDEEIMELKSSGSGEFSSIPIGTVCYRCTDKGSLGGAYKRPLSP